MMKFVLCWLFLFQLQVYGEHILVLLPLGSRSHKMALMPVIEKLAQRGHNITIFSGYKSPSKLENIHEVQIDSLTQLTNMMKSLPELVKFSYEHFLSNQEFQIILKEKNVDLIIVDAILSEATFPFIEHLGVPFIFHCSSTGIPWSVLAMEAMGADLNHASVPFPMTRFDDQMTLRQRIENVYMAEKFRSMRQTYVFDVLDEHVKKDFPMARPTAEIMNEASLVLVNTHSTIDWPRSIPLSVIPIGALHTRPAHQLPAVLKKFTDEANNGFIVFTLGGLVKTTSMPNQTLQVFRNVFSQIPQRVIWKWDGDIPEDASPNVMMIDWLPQQDLLGHQNAKLFITHGGMLGYQEAIYHAVPILGLPLCNDQRSNIAMAMKTGIGLKLDWDHIDEKSLYDTIVRIIGEPSFKGNASKLSRLMRDELVPGKDLAVYWIEYVLRHGGTKHLQLASKNIPTYKQYLLDIILFLFIVLLAVSFVTYSMIHAIFLKFKKYTSLNIKSKNN